MGEVKEGEGCPLSSVRMPTAGSGLSIIRAIIQNRISSSLQQLGSMWPMAAGPLCTWGQLQESPFSPVRPPIKRTEQALSCIGDESLKFNKVAALLDQKWRILQS